MSYLICNIKFILYFTLIFSTILNAKNSTDQSTAGAVDRFYVGSDNACDYSTIQAAINAASTSLNPPEVLVAFNKVYKENLFINLNNILIDGGYSNCTNARNGISSSSRARVEGFPGSQFATMQIIGLFVVIKNIQLDTNIGGGIKANATSVITTSVITLDNLFFFGLGDSAIKVQGGGLINLTVKKSLFYLNTTSTSGAAINCSGSNHSISVVEDTIFLDNTATDIGGAVYVSACDFTMSTGLFQSNNSTHGGGGLSISNNVVQAELNNVTFSNNKAVGASGRGGAIRINESEVIAKATRFFENEAVNLGGAIYIGDDSSFTLSRDNLACSNWVKCNVFDGNKASFGGAIYKRFGTNSMYIDSTYFENNRADLGTAIFTGGYSEIRGSIFTHNGNSSAGFDDRNVIKVIDQSDTRISYSTFAENNALLATFGSIPLSATMQVVLSIIYDASSGDVFEVEGGGTSAVGCVILHETNSYNLSIGSVTVADPMFVDAANGDYHIDAVLSPAVDYCSSSLAVANPDIDFQNRGYDNPDVANRLGLASNVYDIGADEAYGDYVFQDGFE